MLGERKREGCPTRHRRRGNRGGPETWSLTTGGERVDKRFDTFSSVVVELEVDPRRTGNGHRWRRDLVLSGTVRLLRRLIQPLLTPSQKLVDPKSFPIFFYLVFSTMEVVRPYPRSLCHQSLYPSLFPSVLHGGFGIPWSPFSGGLQRGWGRTCMCT